MKIPCPYLLFAGYLFYSLAFNTVKADITKVELASLPPFCQARMGNDANLKKKWSKILGQSNFTWMNHFCSNLIAKKRCFAIIQKQKRYKCYERLTDHSYTLEHTSSNFPLRPLIYYEAGDTFMKIEEYGKAEIQFINAIKANPKFSRPYISLSKIYAKQGNETKAIDIIERGLIKKPSSKALKKIHKKLIK
ncbi:tetratricopeptide repeat protein [Methylotuvimicrobium sp.]|uniref:tetratricopeptide repeat protein n=1 Tax=Methylotuvimicrobium sp. TaxID=2822413 RepID=UPI003D65764D